MSTEGESLQVPVLQLQFPAHLMCWLLRAPDKCFTHTVDSLGRWPQPVCSFHSAKAATLLEFHVPLTNCFVCRWFCVVHGPKPLLHHHNWLSFDKFQDTEHFVILCPCHISSQLPPRVKPTSRPWHLAHKKNWIDMLLSAVSVLVGAQPSSEVPEGLPNCPVYTLSYLMYIQVFFTLQLCVT
jgi:hypothetical protein